ncbi:MAG: L-threonylcarbamoyladenylate synthase [Limisphaerales bacterium]
MPRRTAAGTLVLPTHTPALLAEAVAQAAKILRGGGLVAVPTETVYGLAANALDPVAVAAIFTAKGRPAHNPVIVHVSGRAMARACSSAWPAAADRLAGAFWPGPLTVVVPRAAGIPDAVTGGGPTVGLRWPQHPFMQAVIRACGFPLAAPSANRANELSPTTADHVLAALDGCVPLVVDAGACNVGIESTVVDVTVKPASVLRPGMIHEESLAAVLGDVTAAGGPGEGMPRSPGQLPRHYAPRAPLRVLAWRDDADLRAQLAVAGMPAETTHVIVHTHLPAPEAFARVCLVPHDAEAYARALYAELHACDALGAAAIVVEALPDEPAWRGLTDRLRRAAAR